jgi:hypothetical protein
MKYIYSGAITLLFMGVVLVPSAHAETTTSITSMLEQIKALMAKVEELQKQLATIRGEVKAVLKEGLKEGATDEDIKKIQELLATDSTIYPEGKVTGFFGPLTKEAIRRFQKRHELEVTGTVDADTRALLEGYLKERFGDKIPAGLLTAPGIAKKVELRVKEGCDGTKGMGVLCQKLRIKYKDGKLEIKEKTKSEDGDDAFDVEVEVEEEDNSTTTLISFKFEGETFDVEVDSTDESNILEAVADALDTTVGSLDRDLKNQIKEELKDELDEESDDEDDDFDIEMDIDGNSHLSMSFTFEGDNYGLEIDSIDEDDVLEAVADELDVDLEDLDEELEKAVKDELEDAIEDQTEDENEDEDND